MQVTSSNIVHNANIFSYRGPVKKPEDVHIGEPEIRDFGNFLKMTQKWKMNYHNGWQLI